MIKLDLIIVFLVILFILISLYKELLGATFTFVIAVTVLGFFKILSPGEILNGFANEQIAVIILLLLLGDIIRQTSVIEALFDRIFKSANNYRSFLSRMTIVSSAFSAFMNNTPLVAIMMPYVNNWCKRNDISPSKFLIPLSYATILGGCATLIGTSTNLIVNGMYVDQKIIPNAASLNIFEFAWVGVPMIVIGYFYLVFFGNKLLPSNPDLLTDFSQNSRKYIVEAEIRKNSHLIGKTISDSGLLTLKGLYLVEIARKNYKISTVLPDLIIQQEDLLIFAGDTEVITEMLHAESGLTLPSVGMLNKKKQTEVVEIVISHNSTMIGKTVSEIRFRAKFDAAVIAIHRNGERISSKIGDTLVKAGDVLLLYTGIDFYSRSIDTHDFYFISKVKDFKKIEAYKIWTLLGGTILIILLSAFHLVSLFMGLVVLLMVVIAMKITNPKELYKSVDYNLAMIIALSLALGTAMIKSGAADLVADILTRIFLPLGKVGLLFGIYIITSVLAAYITNKAAVAIVFPVSLMMAANMGLNPVPFVLVVSFAAAANFMTPHGYQTNLMVYGPGGYSFTDFFRVGFPLTIIYMFVTVFILRVIYF
ncbi:MAG: potassium transporter TrkA [Bacteroidetes bacterium GWA2_31_9b]|nr:MAG: potassium transporter TrkA [Bacteroidetes bacterium GWA2_31_9b]